MRRSGLLVFVPDEIEINRLPAASVRVPIIVASREGSGVVTSVSLSAMGRTKALGVRSPITALHLRPDEVLEGFEQSSMEVATELATRAAHQVIDVDLSGVEIEDGSQTLATIAVTAEIAGRSATEIVRIPIQVTSLPRVPGWYGGDGHVHTGWSPDVVFLPISERARFARDNGHGFIIITDHEDGIGRNWGVEGGYCEQCLAAEKEFGIPVLPGAEIGVAGGGHCLAYGMNDKAGTVPSNRGFDARRLLSLIGSHNRPLSYGIAAHPYERRERWSDWSVRDLAGLELINRSPRSNPEAVSQWFTLLNRGLARTLKTGRFVVGVANSDCHNLMEPGGRGFTWIQPKELYDAGYGGPGAQSSPLSRENVWRTIRSGRVVASGSKDLGFFTLNRKEIGEIVHAEAGSTLSFAIEHHPSAGRRCRKVTIISGEGRETVLTPGRPGLPLRYDTRCPRSSTFYVVKFEFAGNGGSRRSEVWTNPVFVRVSGQ